MLDILKSWSFWVFVLILLYLVLINGKASTNILVSSASGGIGLVKALQGR